MALIPTGFGQCSARFTNNALSRAAFVVFGFENLFGYTNPSAAADAIQDVWATTMESSTDTEVQMGPFDVTLENGAGPLTGSGTVSSFGTFSGSAVPANCACLVRKSSAMGGRPGRGRMYLPWFLPDDSVSEGGRIDPTSLAVRQGNVDDLLIALAAADTPMVILHTTAGTPATVLGLTVDNVIGTQRRRLGR